MPGPSFMVRMMLSGSRGEGNTWRSRCGARGLARGEVFTQEGSLVVSVVQEGLIRTSR